MTRRYFRRAKCGHRLVAAVPHEHWKTTTFVGALRCDGLTAPLVIDGAINGELFLAYVEQILVFIPPYSPDLNPIELAFSKLKALPRAKAIQTADALWKSLGDLCDTFSPRRMRQLFPP
jgi:transposase